MGLVATVGAMAASYPQLAEPAGSTQADWGMVGALAGVAAVFIAVLGTVVAVAIAGYGERKAREHTRELTHAVIGLGSAPGSEVVPVGGGVAPPLGLLPAPGRVRGPDGLLVGLRSQLEVGGLVVVVGPGGVGKSTVAGELVRQPQTWWVSGASASTLSAGVPDLQVIGKQAPNGPDLLWRLLERQQLAQMRSDRLTPLRHALQQRRDATYDQEAAWNFARDAVSRLENKAALEVTVSTFALIAVALPRASTVLKRLHRIDPRRSVPLVASLSWYWWYCWSWLRSSSLRSSS